VFERQKKRRKDITRYSKLARAPQCSNCVGVLETMISLVATR